MERRIIRKILVLSLSLFILSSCRIVKPATSTLLGNMAYNQGEYQQAIVHYLDGIKYDKFSEWFYYNMGNVYSAFGESEAALDIWNKALTDDSSDTLAFSLYYNKGCLYFQTGQYEEAVSSFQSALLINHTSLEAKINLELSHNKLIGQRTLVKLPQKIDSTIDNKQRNDSTNRILEYVQRKETNQWLFTDQESAQDSVKDW